MAKLIAVYKTPKNAAAFDEYYFNTHVPIAKKVPGLRRYEVSKGAVGLPIEPGGVHLVAILSFDTLAAVQAGLGSPEGQAAAGDLANFADGGVELMIMDIREV